ncbi:hypothetical protein FOA43_003051 [Brettanomyces nanus]|uniref:t-SNARE coiled-coil homology domain-containing protein n=1 Tax=Eeniella nana TaxID=13502 RepID=A0A875S6T0_EENNA|nr:uncharacterized protein FOA43_003051 [Brettanomyces nanus]QPG75692.1 hypothetical protein FOA43_003051 [Brettanomyces nanus]
MNESFNSAIDLEEQPSYQDSPEFDQVNDDISNGLLEINNMLSNLNKNLIVMERKVDVDGRSGGDGSVEKYQSNSVTLVNRLVGLFKDISLYSRKMNGMDTTMLNKSQIFVKSKLNENLKSSLKKFNELQKSLTDLDKQMNEQVQESHKQSETSPPPQQQQQQQQRLIIEYEPVNAEELEYQRNLVEERERDIEQISHGVSELNEIFHDLSSMVDAQGEFVDNIETNIYSTLHDTRMANKHLRRADRYHRNKRKLCFWLLMIACVVILFVIMIIFA